MIASFVFSVAQTSLAIVHFATAASRGGGGGGYILVSIKDLIWATLSHTVAFAPFCVSQQNSLKMVVGCLVVGICCLVVVVSCERDNFTF